MMHIQEILSIMAMKNILFEEIIEINQMVENKIKYSNLAIQHDYFNYLYNALYNE